MNSIIMKFVETINSTRYYKYTVTQMSKQVLMSLKANQDDKQYDNLVVNI